MNPGRCGFEIELLAPHGHRREGLAQALADELGCKIENGLKMLRAGVNAQGDIVECCDLTPCVRLLGSDGNIVLELVDDYSIQEGLESDSDGSMPGNNLKLVTNDPRLGAFCERQARGGIDFAETIAPWLKVLGLKRVPCDDAAQNTNEVIVDGYGHMVAICAQYPSARRRVAELVTRPFTVTERAFELERLHRQISTMGFSSPAEGSVHVHFDGEPWRNVKRLRRLIIGYHRARSHLLSLLQPNPRTAMWRGAFPDAVIKVASESNDSEPFQSFANRLDSAGLTKRSDLNLLGLIHEHHRQRTLEVRCLAPYKSPAELLQQVTLIEGFLTEISRLADAA